MTTKVHVLSRGRPGAPLVVFAHGLEDSWASWHSMAKQFDPDWRLLAIELPWRAGNDYEWRTRRPGEWLGDGLDLIGTVPDVLVAHSFGANAALELMCAFDPRAGRSAALLCPLYRLPHLPVTWRMLDRSRTSFVENIREGVRARLGSRVDALSPALLDTMIEMAVDRVGPAGFLTVFDQFVNSANLALGGVELPTLVIAGDSDPNTSGEVAAELAAGMPGAGVFVGEGFDHFCHIRRAADVAGRITRLVGTVHTPIRTAGQHR